MKAAIGAAVVVVVLAAAVGFEMWRSRPTGEEADLNKVLQAYRDNPADADAKYKGKRLKVTVLGATMGQTDGRTTATHTPGMLTPQRYARFYFVSEQEAARAKPDRAFVAVGDCEGMDGNVVVFRGCVVAEVK